MNLATEIKTGTPQAEGRYVAFVRCQVAAAREWVEPIVMAWHGGRWHTSMISQRRIIGWLGPLPVLKVDDLASNDEHPMPIADEPEQYFEDRNFAPVPVFDL